MSEPRPRLYIQEVAPRDGFQNEAQFVDTDAKVALLDELGACGFAKIEVTSFTSPRAIPALRDAEEVMHRIRRYPGVVYTALVPNLRGVERALSCSVDEVNLVMSVSESHNRANLRMTREQSFEQLSRVIAEVTNTPVEINVSLSTVFGCPMEGDIATDDVLRWIGRFTELGVHGITLCDTTGMAFPRQVKAICEAAREAVGPLPVTLHFHNTRGMALANTLAALDAGIDRFDASLGGLGGCPFAPNATGNINTEDTVFLLESEGLDTGIDIGALLAIREMVAGWLPGEPFTGAIARAGLPKTFVPTERAAEAAH